MGEYNTPGCTAQACSIRDSYHDLQKASIIVWGISSNPPASHANFKDKYHLPFTLLSDGTKEVAALYSVKGWFLVDRVTFLIDEQGIVVGILNNVDVKAHARQIIDAFARHAQK
jgi:peroxiredoxin Q/BCP